MDEQGPASASAAPADASPAVPDGVRYPRVKSWRDRTAEEKRAIFDAKRRAKKERAKARKSDVKTAQKKKWESLSEAEQARVRAEAAAKYDERRRATAALHELSEARLADATTPSIVFDLQFEHVMNDRGVKSTVAQLKFSYALLRAAAFPFKPVFYDTQAQPTDNSAAASEHNEAAAPASAQGVASSSGQANTIGPQLQHFEGFAKYPPRTIAGSWAALNEAFNGNVVYLSADSDTVLQDIEPGTAYVVGAFVDHNAKKNLTKAFADDHHVKTARLPIQESVDTTNLCRVLTINHVVAALVHFTEHKSWTKAFTEVLPTRRQTAAEKRAQRQATGQSKSGDGTGESDDEDDDGHLDSASDDGDDHDNAPIGS